MTNDGTLAALGITAIVTTVQETVPLEDIPPVAYKIMRAALAGGAVLLISRRPWQRAVVTGLGIWGTAELLQLGYSALMLGADTLLMNIQQQRRHTR